TPLCVTMLGPKTPSNRTASQITTIATDAHSSGESIQAGRLREKAGVSWETDAMRSPPCGSTLPHDASRAHPRPHGYRVARVGGRYLVPEVPGTWFAAWTTREIRSARCAVHGL